MPLPRLCIALIAAAAVAAGPAFAADEGIPPEFRTGTFDLYLGTYVSGNTMTSQYEDVAAGEHHGLDGGAFGWGVRGGVDYIAGDWVFGVVGDGSFGGAIAENDDQDVTLEMPVLGTIRGRAGYKWADTLVYATGGYALAEFNFDVSESATGPASSQSAWGHGWTLGLGADFAVTDSISMGLEYLYVKLDEAEYSEDYKQEFGGIHTLRLGIDYRFHI